MEMLVGMNRDIIIIHLMWTNPMVHQLSCEKSQVSVIKEHLVMRELGGALDINEGGVVGMII